MKPAAAAQKINLSKLQKKYGSFPPNRFKNWLFKSKYAESQVASNFTNLLLKFGMRDLYKTFHITYLYITSMYNFISLPFFRWLKKEMATTDRLEKKKLENQSGVVDNVHFLKGGIAHFEVGLRI